MWIGRVEGMTGPNNRRCQLCRHWEKPITDEGIYYMADHNKYVMLPKNVQLCSEDKALTSKDHWCEKYVSNKHKTWRQIKCPSCYGVGYQWAEVFEDTQGQYMKRKGHCHTCKGKGYAYKDSCGNLVVHSSRR